MLLNGVRLTIHMQLLLKQLSVLLSAMGYQLSQGNCCAIPTFKLYSLVDSGLIVVLPNSFFTNLASNK